MKHLLLFLVVPALCARQVIPLWQGPAPGSENWMQQEVNYKNSRGEAMVRNVVNPTLTAYLPEGSQATGTAVVIAPGGGFRFLSWDSEGVFVAKWLAERGVAAFVLKYRVVESPAPEAEYQTFLASFILKTAVEDSLSGQVLCLQAVTATAVVTKLVKCEAVANSMDSSACGRPLRSTAVFRLKSKATLRPVSAAPLSSRSM